MAGLGRHDVMAASNMPDPASAKILVIGDDPDTDAAVSVVNAQLMATQRREAHVSESLLQVAHTLSGLYDSAQMARLGTQVMLVAPVPRVSPLSGAVLLCGGPARRFSVYDLTLAKGVAHQIA